MRRRAAESHKRRSRRWSLLLSSLVAITVVLALNVASSVLAHSAGPSHRYAPASRPRHASLQQQASSGPPPPRRAPVPTHEVVALGDSVPSGYACDCTPFVRTYAAMVARQLGVDAAPVDLAVAGFTSADVREQLQAPASRSAVASADTIVLMAGANDFTRPFSRALNGECAGEDCYMATEQSVTANLIATVEAVRAVHKTPISVLILGYWNIAEDGSVGRAAYGSGGMANADQATTAANAALQRAAEVTGAEYVSTFAAFRGATGEKDPTDLLAPDGDHPNQAGHDRIAAALFAAAPRG